MQRKNYICVSAFAAILLNITTVLSSASHLPPFITSNSLDFAFEQTGARATIDKVLYNNYHLPNKAYSQQYDISKGSLNFRLPNETYPEHYDIKLTTNVHKGEEDYQGEVIIDIVVIEATSKIVIHAGEFDYTKVSITNSVADESEELSYEYEAKREFLTLTRNNTKQFLPETKWKLTINYNGKLRTDLHGFHISSYTDHNGKERFLASTHFERPYARLAFPCYDEPNKRANFSITILHDPTYNAISNMPVNEARSSNGTTVFLTTARIPSYIVAFVVSDFESTAGTLNHLPQRVYSRNDTKYTQTWSMASSMLLTQSISEYLGVNFMLTKLDHVAVPFMEPGGMENWGLIIYPEKNLLYDKHKSTTFAQTKITNTLAHEIAHQWFGDFVGIKWWTYLWIKEGFATLLGHRATADVYPEWDIWQQFHTEQHQPALRKDFPGFCRPMTYFMKDPKEWSNWANFINYRKASAVLNMWNNALTDKVFQRGLYNYLTINQYTATDEDQLFSAIQIAAREKNYKIPASINEMMSSWSRQTGFPLLTVTRNYENGSFTVKQEVFYTNTTIRDERKWYVPINYAVSSEPDFHNTEAMYYLLNETDIKINATIAKNNWLILNKQSAYYYRIKYDEENYKLITKSLVDRPHKIHVLNRAQLLDDVYAMSFSNHFDHKVLLNMMTYLKKEDQFAPWSVASNILIDTLDKYMRGYQNYYNFKFFMADLVEPIYKKLGVADDSGEHHIQKSTRNLIINLACLAGIEDCLQETREKLKAYVKDNAALEVNLQDSVFCSGLINAGDEVFDYMLDLLIHATDSSYTLMLVSKLACTQNENHLRKYLKSTKELSTEGNKNAIMYIYRRSEIGFLLCMEFFHEHWNETPFLADHMTEMSKLVVNKNLEEKYLELLEKVKGSKEVLPTLESSAKAIIAENFKWVKENGDPLMAWFTQYHIDKLPNGSAVLSASALLIAFAFVSTVIRLL